MKNQLAKSFKYLRMPVRVISIDNEPWWVLKDVCDILGISNSRMVADRLDDDEKGVSLTDTLGGRQELTIINESGLYSVILRSDKPEAQKFKRWITHDVLPTIRKQGFYGQLTRADAMEMCHKHKVSVEEYCQYRTGKDFAEYATVKVRALQSWKAKKQDYGMYIYTIESLAEEMGLDKDTLAGALYDGKLNRRKDCCRWFDDCGWRFSWFGRYLLDGALPKGVRRNAIY